MIMMFGLDSIARHFFRMNTNLPHNPKKRPRYTLNPKCIYVHSANKILSRPRSEEARQEPTDKLWCCGAALEIRKL